MTVAHLLEGLDPINDKWRRRHCAAELRRLAEAGRLGRRVVPTLRRFVHSPGMTFLAEEHLHSAVIAIEHGKRTAIGWTAARFGEAAP